MSKSSETTTRSSAETTETAPPRMRRPRLDRAGQVRGGLLLGHAAPGRFSPEDERLLSGLAAQAAVALENARLYRSARTQAQALDAILGRISDAVLLVDGAGQIVRANRARGEADLTVRDRGIGIRAGPTGAALRAFRARRQCARGGHRGHGAEAVPLARAGRAPRRTHLVRVGRRQRQGAGSAFSIALPLATDADDEGDEQAEGNLR